MKAHSIDEYLKFKSQGVKVFEFDQTNKEVLDFFMEELKSDTISMLKKHRINTLNGIYSYNKNSIIPFGKHKGNVLKCVYKCDPNYIEWLLVNADSFCIDLETLKEMQLTKTWFADDLEFISNATEEFILDIRNLNQDKN